MSDVKHCHPLNHQGASRISRLVRALHPDAFQLDERSIQDMIVATHRYAQTLKFFDETNTQPDGAYWDTFWEVEILTYLAVVAATDTNEIRRQYESGEAQIKNTPPAKTTPGHTKKTPGSSIGVYLPLLEQLRLLALSLEDAYQKLVRIKHPLQTLLLNRIRRDNCCDQEELEGALVRLIGFHKGADSALSMSNYVAFFAPDKRWGLEDRVDYDAISANPHFSQNDLRELFNSFYNTWLVLKNAAQAGFDAELARMELPEEVEYRIVQPHIVLFLVFLRLFRYAKESLNELGTKHLDFYYEEILGLRRRGEVPDEVYLLFELAKDFDQHLLEKGTEFLAGKDKNGQPLLFETIEDWVLRPAQVADIKNTYIDLNCGGIQGNPDVKKLYFNGAEKPNESAGTWRAMGDDLHLPDGAIGFAISSPQLILREGKRIVDITLNLINEIAQPDKLESEYFRVFLSSEEEWITPGFDPIVVPDSTQIPDLAKGSFGMTFETKAIRLRVVLERDDLPVDHLGEALAAKAGFDTQWPIIKVIIDPALEKPCPADQNPELTTSAVYEMLRTLLIGEIIVKVVVRGIRENLIIQSDQGVFDGTQKVFPFGPVPEIGNRFYIGSTEVFQKALNTLQVRFDWIAPPSSFKDHYQDYTNVNSNLYPTPNPKVLIEFIDRADDKRILITQVLRDGVLLNSSTAINVKISDINFNPIEGVTFTSDLPGVTFTPDPSVAGQYFITLPKGTDLSKVNPAFVFAKGSQDDFEPLTISLKENGIPSAFIEVVLFPREKIFKDFASQNLIKGSVKTIYGEGLDDFLLNNQAPTDVSPNGDYSKHPLAAIPATLDFSRTDYSPVNILTKGFSVIDALLYPIPFSKPPVPAPPTFSSSLRGRINSLEKLPKNLPGVNIVAKQGSTFIAATKSISNGDFFFPDISGANSLEFFFEDNEQYAFVDTPASSELNVGILPRQITKIPPAGNINIECKILHAYSGQNPADVDIIIGNSAPVPVQIGATFKKDNISQNVSFELTDAGGGNINYQEIQFNAENNTEFEVLMLPQTGDSNKLLGGGSDNNKVQLKFINPNLPDSNLLNPQISVGGTLFPIINGSVQVVPFTSATIKYPGFEELTISDANIAKDLFEVSLTPKQFDKKLPINSNTNKITGTVIHPNGGPFANARVIAKNAAEYYETVAGADGKFEINIPADTFNYRIIARHKAADGKDYISISPVDKLVKGTDDVTILLGHIKKSRSFKGTVEGVVKKNDGVPLAGAKIISGGISIFTDKSGNYSFKNVTANTLEFIHPLYEKLSVDLTDNSNVDIVMLPVKDRAYWVFEGIVSDIFNVPLKNVGISLQTGTDNFEITKSGNDGQFRIAVPDTDPNKNTPVTSVIFSIAGFEPVLVNFPPTAPKLTRRIPS